MLVRPVSAVWYLKSRAYVLFMVRELTSVFNALYVVLLVALLHALSNGPAAYAEFLRVLWAPPMLVLHAVALAFAVFHTVTWFNATGKAVVIRRGEERLPDAALVVPNYVAWAAVSALTLWAVTRG